MEEIDNIIKSLNKAFGVKAPVKEKALRILYNSKLYGECLREVLLHFGIPITLKVKCISGSKSIEEYLGMPKISGNTPAIMQTEFNGSYYKSTLVRKTVIGATLYIRKEIIEQGFEPFMFTTGHEFSHLIMHMHDNQLASNEKAADILSLVMGFCDLARSGRKRDILWFQTTLGYLSDEEFERALFLIENLRK